MFPENKSVFAFHWFIYFESRLDKLVILWVPAINGECQIGLHGIFAGAERNDRPIIIIQELFRKSAVKSNFARCT